MGGRGASSNSYKYIRFGAIPESGKSVNWFKLSLSEQRDVSYDLSIGQSLEDAIRNNVKDYENRNIFEEGVSVFKMDSDGLPKIENLQQLVSVAERLDDKIYKVSGIAKAKGTDDEPILAKAKGVPANVTKQQMVQKMEKVLSKNYSEVSNSSKFYSDISWVEKNKLIVNDATPADKLLGTSAKPHEVIFNGKVYRNPKWNISRGYNAYR